MDDDLFCKKQVMIKCQYQLKHVHPLYCVRYITMFIQIILNERLVNVWGIKVIETKEHFLKHQIKMDHQI